jgi:metal-responsive CopG/Arc/MetJ family transcriptional regulator
METVRLVLDSKLLKAVDVAAEWQKVSRSALIRQALQEHPNRLHVLDLEERDRRGYQAKPQRVKEYRRWEKIAVLSCDGQRVCSKVATGHGH